MFTNDIEKAVDALQAGGLIIYPTEAVFGLGCDPQNSNAVQRLLDLKQRPAHKGLIIIASEKTQLAPYVAEDIDEKDWQKALASWPGPVTWLFPCRPGLSELVRGEHDTIAVRISDHPVVKALCDAFDGAMISTSANLAGEPAVKLITDLNSDLRDRVDVVIDAEVGGSNKPSEIRDLITDKIIRAG